MRDPHLLARRPERDAALEVQPVRAGAARAIRPALAPIELGDQREPAMLSGIEVPGELGDLGFELIERTARRGRRVPIHGSDSEDIAKTRILQKTIDSCIVFDTSAARITFPTDDRGNEPAHRHSNRARGSARLPIHERRTSCRGHIHRHANPAPLTSQNLFLPIPPPARQSRDSSAAEFVPELQAVGVRLRGRAQVDARRAEARPS